MLLDLPNLHLLQNRFLLANQTQILYDSSFFDTRRGFLFKMYPRSPYLGAYCLSQTTSAYVDPLDEFAQTRPPDDLFDDDFTPIAPPVVEQLESSSTTAVTPTQPPTAPPNAPRGPRAHTTTRGRDTHPPPSTRAAETSTPPNDSEAPAAAAVAAPQASRPSNTAVRGDRTLTGGPARAKLSERELEAKMAAMAVKNAALQAAHEKSAADAEAFAAREAAAVVRRREDRVARAAQDAEREKNRLRKLKASGGREWDSEKREEEFGTPERAARRGGYGGVAASRFAAEDRREFGAVPAATEQDPVSQWVESQAREVFGDRGRGRGRGGRGRGRGRGGRENGDHQQRQQSSQLQAPPTASDFPDLPSSGVPKSQATDVQPAATLQFPNKKHTKPEDSKLEDEKAEVKAEQKVEQKDDRPKPIKQPSFGLSKGEKKSWADQMDSVTSPT